MWLLAEITDLGSNDSVNRELQETDAYPLIG